MKDLNKREIIEKTKTFIKHKLEGEGTGHDWWHVDRVYRLAKRIAKEEKADSFTVELAALLHDISDWKFNKGDLTVGAQQAKKWLLELGLEEKLASHVEEIIETAPFKGSKVKTPMRTLEGKVVQDADRLDAIGAIGIARAFAYGGWKGRVIYNPNGKIKIHKSFEEYRKGADSTLHHLYEKLLLLKEMLNTKSAKRIAVQRHKFMLKFINQFMEEWKEES
jgi:uncharacterized protein